MTPAPASPIATQETVDGWLTDLVAMHNAPSGKIIGETWHVSNWGNKPHRVLYDAIKIARAAIEALSASEKRNEELVKENEALTTGGAIEVAVRNNNVRHYMDHWEGRATASEALVTSLKAENERLTRAQPIDADANYVRGVRDGLRAYEENWSLERLATERARLARIHDAIVSARAALRPADEPVTQREM